MNHVAILLCMITWVMLLCIALPIMALYFLVAGIESVLDVATDHMAVQIDRLQFYIIDSVKEMRRK